MKKRVVRKSEFFLPTSCPICGDKMNVMYKEQRDKVFVDFPCNHLIFTDVGEETITLYFKENPTRPRVFAVRNYPNTMKFVYITVDISFIIFEVTRRGEGSKKLDVEFSPTDDGMHTRIKTEELRFKVERKGLREFLKSFFVPVEYEFFISLEDLSRLYDPVIIVNPPVFHGDLKILNPPIVRLIGIDDYHQKFEKIYVDPPDQSTVKIERNYPYLKMFFSK